MVSTTFEIFRNSPDAVAYSAGQVVFSEGDQGDVMYVVKSGEVDIRRGEQIYNTHGAGAIFGEMALIEKAPRSADAVAKTDCELVPIGERQFIFLVQQTPFFALQVMRVIAERLRQRMSGG